MATDLALDPGGISVYQWAIGIFIVAAGALAFAAGRYLMEFAGLPDEQTRQKKHLLGQLDARASTTLRLRKTDALEDRWADVHATIRAAAGDGDALPERSTVRQAVGIAWRDVRDAWFGALGRFPRLVVRFGEVALLVAVFGGLATVSVETVRRVVTAGDGVSSSVVLSAVQDAAATAADTLVATVTSFPYFDTVYGIAIGYAILAADWLWHHPLVPAGLLLGLAVVATLLHRRAPAVATERVYDDDRRNVVLFAAAALTVVWLAGVVPAVALGALGLGQVGGMVGFASAMLTGLVVVAYLVRDLRARLDETRRRVGGSGWATAYQLARWLGALVAGVAVPLVPTYLFHLVTTGKLAAVVQAFLAGSVAVQAAVGVAVLGVLVLMAAQTRSAWPEFRAAVAELASRRAVRSILFVRGPAVLAFPVLYFLGVGFTGSAVAGALGALGGSLLLLQFLRVVRWVRYRAVTAESHERTPSNLLVQATALETADGDRKYHVAVNDVTLAHDDAAALADVVVRVARDLFADGEARPTVAAQHAEDLLEYGIVDYEETEQKLRADVKAATTGRLRRKNGQMPREALESKLEDELPESVWREWLQEKRVRGSITLRNGRYELSGRRT